MLFTSAMGYCEIWDLPFYLDIRDTLFGTYRIEHRVGGLYVVCGGLIWVWGYLMIPYKSTEIDGVHCLTRHFVSRCLIDVLG